MFPRQTKSMSNRVQKSTLTRSHNQGMYNAVIRMQGQAAPRQPSQKLAAVHCNQTAVNMSSPIKYDYCNYSTLCNDPVRQAFCHKLGKPSAHSRAQQFLCEKLNFIYCRVVRRSRSAILTFVKEFSKVFFAPLNAIHTLGLK